MKVRLRIGRLVVEGASPEEARRIGSSLEQELGRLIAEGGLPQSWGGSTPTQNIQVPHLDAGSLKAPSTGQGQAQSGGLGRDLGSRLAGQLYKGGDRG